MGEIIDKIKEKAKDVKDTVVDTTKDTADKTKDTLDSASASSSNQERRYEEGRFSALRHASHQNIADAHDERF